jgi:thymidylate synthase (FAD)
MHKYEKSICIYDDNVGRVDYISHMGNDLTVVNSARVSFGVERNELDQRDHKLIKYLIKHRHTSTLEHCAVTFKFTVPLFVRSQHHRHRTWSYNEISRRYTDKGLKFYVPNNFRTQHKSNRQASNTDTLVDPVIIPDLHDTGYGLTASGFLKRKTDEALQAYRLLIREGVCREQARMILPQNLYTEYYGTTNLNNLLKFIDLRTHDGAQWEIQKVAEACLQVATDLFPATVSSYKELRGEL